jgi:hypothetical protein
MSSASNFVSNPAEGDNSDEKKEKTVNEELKEILTTISIYRTAHGGSHKFLVISDREYRELVLKRINLEIENMMIELNMTKSQLMIHHRPKMLTLTGERLHVLQAKHNAERPRVMLMTAREVNDLFKKQSVGVTTVRKHRRSSPGASVVAAASGDFTRKKIKVKKHIRHFKRKVNF